ncbi:CPXCG motif-containing cysteine-rich protein [Arenicella sp.]|nr:CPXCG motif-containing cysteine-rich protein [Arenicella sp.]
MNSLFESRVTCPYCNESFTAFIDLSQGNHRTIEDCYVCCRPIEFLVESDGNQLFRVDTFTDTDSVF